MSPIPGEPHERGENEFTDKQGRKVKLKMPGLPPRPVAGKTAQRGEAEPPRDDPRPTVNPDHAGF
jgi:hypothetical protein